MRNRDEESRDEGRHYRPAGPAQYGVDGEPPGWTGADDRGHHPRHHRYTAMGTAPVPPASQAGSANQSAAHRQPMPAPRSMPTAGLSRPPRAPRPASVSPAPPPLPSRGEPTPINGYPRQDPIGTPPGIRPVPGWPTSDPEPGAD